MKPVSLALLALGLSSVAMAADVALPGTDGVGGGVAGGAMTYAALVGVQSLLGWLKSIRAEDQQKAAASAQVKEAKDRAAADAALAGRVAALEAAQVEIRAAMALKADSAAMTKIEAALALKADADDLARVESAQTREATAQATFREALAGRIGKLEGELRTALAAAGRAGAP